MGKLNPIGALFGETWALYKKHFSTFIGITVVPYIGIWIGAAILKFGGGTATAVLGSLAMVFGYILFPFALLSLVLFISRGGTISEAYRSAKSLFWPFVWLGILSSVITLGGYVMLIVPGILMGIWFSFSLYILVLENKRGLSILLQSRGYVEGFWWAILWRFILLTLVYIAALIVMGILSILLTPILGRTIFGVLFSIIQMLFVSFPIIYSYSIYQNLRELKPALATTPATKGRKFFIVSGIVGLVAPILIVIALASIIAMIRVKQTFI